MSDRLTQLTGYTSNATPSSVSGLTFAGSINRLRPGIVYLVHSTWGYQGALAITFHCERTSLYAHRMLAFENDHAYAPSPGVQYVIARLVVELFTIYTHAVRPQLEHLPMNHLPFAHPHGALAGSRKYIMIKVKGNATLLYMSSYEIPQHPDTVITKFRISA